MRVVNLVSRETSITLAARKKRMLPIILQLLHKRQLGFGELFSAE